MSSTHRHVAGAIAWIVALELVVCGSVAAPTVRHMTAAGHATITILRPTSTTLLSGMSFGLLRTDSARTTGGSVTIASALPTALTFAGVEPAGGGSGPAIYRIKGERNHTYTVSFPSPAVASSPGGYRVSNFTLWSENSGAITSGGIGHLSAMGTDTLRVGATLTMPSGQRPATITAVVPITILAQ